MSTVYHSKYYAHEITKRYSSDKLEKLSQSLFNATIDLNPHQIEAALFAFRSPLSRGAILADEVGLGKTIEAGLIISQLWSERKRQILIITPASLREQWNRELIEKFFIDSIILEAKNFNQFIKQDIDNPFDQQDKIILCSYHFAKSKDAEIQKVPWDLVVMDEAHRLRNVYRKDNKIAKAILNVIGNRPKVLLTATPLQNSLMELYGLVSFIDPHLFGSEDFFRSQFARRASEMGSVEFNNLRARIQPICQRTLRRQVLEYIRFTNRVPITQDFTPSDEELRLYEAVSAYLQRQDAYALPAGQRSLMTLVLRKILASSSFAIAKTLGSLVNRLEDKLSKFDVTESDDTAKILEEDYESLRETQDEWNDNDKTSEIDTKQKDLAIKAIKQESEELRQYKTLAESITNNAKGDALLIALKTGFKKAAEIGAPHKALIFTESRRTQSYLKDLLIANEYGGGVVTFSGTNNDPDSLRIYRDWLKRNEGKDIITGLKNVDLRSAIVEEFRDRASIMIATESGAEGINLQFCSLVVNYDLPWNPQRIEQRIGRCHRYGQKYDVVVINFLNRKNEADKRVFELLSEKLQLFSGVFGASDEVLGALESGVDFEKRINDIYQKCRTHDEIKSAFDQLQLELEGQIRIRMEDTRAKLMENFDEDVRTRLRFNYDLTLQQVGRFEDWLWRLTIHELSDCASYDHDSYAFKLEKLPEGIEDGNIPLGRYRLITHKDGAEEHHYRIGHPLAEHLLARAKDRPLPSKEILFKYSQHEGKISLLENLLGQSGWLRLSLLTIHALEKEEHLIFCGLDDNGNVVDSESCAKLFSVAGELGAEATVPESCFAELDAELEKSRDNIIQKVAERNNEYFESEMNKLENWADDLKQGLERELKELDKEIKEVKKEARQSAELDSKITLHKKAKELEKKRNEKRRNLFEAQDEVDNRKEGLIGGIEARLKQQITAKELFTIRWGVV